jgi:hypothetical protein
MSQKRKRQAARQSSPTAKRRTRSRSILSGGGRQSKILAASLSKPRQQARDRALHAIAAMRRNPLLSLSRAAKSEGVKAETVKKNFPLALRKSGGHFRATKSDRYSATLYIPDAYGNSVPLQTRSSSERQQASQYLRDLGRYLRGDTKALAKWHGKRIAGVELVTAGRTLVAIEPALSDFSLYRAFNGGTA